ncbi:hypothetical protein D3C79_1018000 [compost metagenome]
MLPPVVIDLRPGLAIGNGHQLASILEGGQKGCFFFLATQPQPGQQPYWACHQGAGHAPAQGAAKAAVGFQAGQPQVADACQGNPLTG